MGFTEIDRVIRKTDDRNEAHVSVGYPTEGEEFVIYYIEAENLDEAMIGMGVSLDPFDQYFRLQVKSIHDLILADPPPWPEQALEFQD